ncbi:MAG: peptide-N-glycosidase, partial [Bacteroidetes bacterium]|nr:peptide-N-glycosidase [Bacteroidota bacterium]
YKDKNAKEYQGVVATENYLPALELMRFFTPFGVRAFNSNVKIEGYLWADSVNYKQDITDLLPDMQGEVWIGVFIGNYDKGGHIINLDLNYYPDREAEAKKNWIEPIFNTLNILEMAGQPYGTMFDHDSLTVTVNIPEHLKTLTLRYIATGHGGWGGGDEYNKKENEIFLDGSKIFGFIPWRTDCATYRLYNPSSGNFGDGLSSSDLSRSNWCPGTTTNPVYIPVKNFSAGLHTFKIAIPLGQTEGTSFSAWNISGTLIGTY